MGTVFRRPLSDWLLSFGLACALNSVAVSEDDWRARFLKESPSQWAAMEEFWAKAEGTLHIREYVVPETASKKFPREYTVDFSVDGNSAVIKYRHSEPEKDDGSQVVHAFNPQYAFHFSENTKANVKQLRYLGQPSADSNMVFQVQLYEWLRAPFTLMAKSHLKEPFPEGLILDRVAPIVEDGRELIEVVYHFDPPTVTTASDNVSASHTGSASVRSFSAKYVLDPKDHWTVQRYEWDVGSAHGEGSVEYGSGIDGYPAPKVVKRSLRGSQPGTVHTVATFQEIAWSKSDPQAFTLSGYGLPEPDLDAVVQQDSRWIWFVLAGLGAATAAVALRYFHIRSVRRAARGLHSP